ncbi:MAG: DUF6680 family protein [Elusimicrobiota bacterium]
MHLINFVFSKEGASFLAILLSPIIAVVVSKWLQDRERKYNDKLNLFRSLVVNRRVALSNDRVSALNIISIIFSNNKNILTLWEHYYKIVSAEKYDNKLADDKYDEIIREMACLLNFDSNLLNTKEPYIPQGHVDTFFRSEETQKELLKALQKYNGEVNK